MMVANKTLWLTHIRCEPLSAAVNLVRNLPVGRACRMAIGPQSYLGVHRDLLFGKCRSPTTVGMLGLLQTVIHLLRQATIALDEDPGNHKAWCSSAGLQPMVDLKRLL